MEKTHTMPTPTEEYPYVISVRGTKPVLARADEPYYWCKGERCLGIVWHPRDVQVLATLAGVEPLRKGKK